MRKVGNQDGKTLHGDRRSKQCRLTQQQVCQQFGHRVFAGNLQRWCPCRALGHGLAAGRAGTQLSPTACCGQGQKLLTPRCCQQMLLPTIPSFLFALENISLNENWRRQLEIGKVPLGQALQQRTCNNYRFKMSESSPSPQAGMDPFVL